MVSYWRKEGKGGVTEREGIRSVSQVEPRGLKGTRAEFGALSLS